MKNPLKNLFTPHLHLAWLGFAVLLVLLLAFSALPMDWSSWQPATCRVLEGCFCELPRPGTVLQPANAWSSLAFVLVGLLVAAQSRHDQRSAVPDANPMLRSWAFGLIYCLALAVVGLGSAFYHASLSFAGQFFDVAGMYLLGTFIIFYNLGRLHPLGRLPLAAGYAAANLVLFSLLLFAPEYRRTVFLLLVLLIIGLEAWIWRRDWPRLRARYFLFSLGSMALAFLIWNLEQNPAFCSPASWLQGHALWHLLGAASAGWIYLYYRSEKRAS